MKTSEFASLTEAERLEKQVERLEKRIEQTEERLEQKGRTKKQRASDKLALERMNSKLDKLQRRIQLEESGKKNWSLVRKEVKRPSFGLNTFTSLDFLRRKKALAETAEAAEYFPQRRAPKLTTIVEQAVAKNIEDKLRAKRALLQGRKITKIEEPDVWVKLGTHGARELDPAIEEEFKAQMKDEREFHNGWLRISDVREDFMKSIGFYPEEDNRGMKTRQRSLWQNYRDRGDPEEIQASKFEIMSPVARPRSLRQRRHCSPVQRADGRSRASPARSQPATPEKPEKRADRSAAAKKLPPPITPRGSKPHLLPEIPRKSLTTSFLPMIPQPEAKRRPNTSDVEKFKDDRDEMLQREKIRLIPNKRRVAENRARLFMTQMDFARTHRLSSKKVVEGLTYAIEECVQSEDKISAARATRPTPREKLYLIGALSKDHIKPLGARTRMEAK